MPNCDPVIILTPWQARMFFDGGVLGNMTRNQAEYAIEHGGQMGTTIYWVSLPILSRAV